MGAEAGDVGGVEDDVRIHPHEFFEPVGEGVGGHLAAGGVDGRVAGDAADGVAEALERAQGVVAARFDGPAGGHEYDAAGGVGVHAGGPRGGVVGRSVRTYAAGPRARRRHAGKTPPSAAARGKSPFASRPDAPARGTRKPLSRREFGRLKRCGFRIFW